MVHGHKYKTGWRGDGQVLDYTPALRQRAALENAGYCATELSATGWMRAT